MKNRNKRLRNIIVDDNNYKWFVEDDSHDVDERIILKIWDSNKKLIYNDRVDMESISPSFVAKIIKDVNKK